MDALISPAAAHSSPRSVPRHCSPPAAIRGRAEPQRSSVARDGLELHGETRWRGRRRHSPRVPAKPCAKRWPSSSADVDVACRLRALTLQSPRVGRAVRLFPPTRVAVVALAQRVGARDRGAFDATVAPAVNAWGFGPGRTHRVVAADERGQLARRIGYASLRSTRRRAARRRRTPASALDFSGIAKGYAVDRAAAALDALDVARYMVEAAARSARAASTPMGRRGASPSSSRMPMPPRPHFVVRSRGCRWPLPATTASSSSGTASASATRSIPRGGRRSTTRSPPASVAASDCA